MEKEIVSNKDFTHTQAVALKNEALWQGLSKIQLIEVISQFLAKLSPHTQRSYATAFDLFFQKGILNPNCNLQQFSLHNLENILDHIKDKTDGKEATKQARCACFISFSAYLARRTQGMIRKAIPCKDNGATTFKKIRRTAVTEALTEKELTDFLRELNKLSYRDCLIARTILQGAKRLDEVLNAKISQINWQEKKITFKQSKSKELEQITVIHYPESFIQELKDYTANRSQEDYIFITRNGKKIAQPHIFRSFVSSSIKASITKKVSAHSLRATAITIFSSRGYSVEQIMKVSGHTSPTCVTYYDKTPIEKNISKEVNLIG